jgi:CRISPR system Cascade subunit CasB
VALLAAREEPLDWDRLLKDCLSWSHPDRYAQVAWAREYWSPTPDTATADR